MAKKKDLHFSIYSLRELTPEEYRAFKMPQYPFAKSKGGPLTPETEAYFKELGIIHYRDAASSFGITIKPDDDDPLPIEERSGFLAYKSGGLVGFRSLEISHWRRENNPVMYDRLVKKWGDDCAWFWRSRPMTISLMNSSEVRTS